MIACWLMCVNVTVLPIIEVGEVQDHARRKYPGRVVSAAEVNVVPQVSGEILEVGFANGQMVGKGDLLYRIDSVKYEAAVKNAEARVAEQKANARYAELSAERHKALVVSRAVSQDALDNAISQRDAARAALAAAEADLVSARDDLKHCRITAPIDGKVGTTAQTEGNYVQKGSAPLVSLIQVSPIRVRFAQSNADYHDVFGSDAKRLAADGSVSVQLIADGAACVTGRVEYVDNASDALTDTIDVYALVENGNGALSRGQTVMVTLGNAKGVRRAAIPPNAVVQDLQGPFVWLLDAENKAVKRRIVRGEIAEGRQMVLSGLSVGDRIVADGVHKVREGMTVSAE